MHLLHFPIFLALALPIAAADGHDNLKEAVQAKPKPTLTTGVQDLTAVDHISLPMKPERLESAVATRNETASVQAGPATRISIGIDPRDWIRRYR